jgi:hypothetical protein
MLSAVLCLGYHYTMVLIVRASIHPFLKTQRTDSTFPARLLKMKQVITGFCNYLESLKTDEVNGFWPPWCQAAFSSLCYSQLMMAAYALTKEDAMTWFKMLQQTRQQLRIKSNSLSILRLGLLRIDSIFWRGIDVVLHLDTHVIEAFRDLREES